MKLPLILLALSAGYAVLVASQKQTRPLDVLGRWVGGTVLAVSFVSLLCMAYCAVAYKVSRCGIGKDTAAGCSMMGGGSKKCAMPHGGGEEAAPAE